MEEKSSTEETGEARPYTRQTARRSEVVWGRVTRADKQAIEKAAELLDTSVSSVTAEGASRFAAEVLAESEVQNKG